MGERWAKVPEWLLDALVATDVDAREGSSPATALAVFTALSAKHADWTTGRARATYAMLGADVGVAWRAAYRVARFLNAVGAVTVDRQPNRRGGQVANEFTLHLDRRVSEVTPHLTAVPSMAPTSVSDGTPVADETAGQSATGVSLVAPLYPESQLLPEANDAEKEWWELLDEPSEEVVQHALEDSWAVFGGRRAPAVRAMRAASHPPEPSPRVPDLGGACSEVARRLTEDARTAASAEGSS